MPNFPKPNRDLMSLWFEAPFVIAVRSRQMSEAIFSGSNRNAGKFNKMVTEKAAAAAESAMGVNLALARQGMSAMLSMMAGRKPATGRRSADKLVKASLKPYGKRVRSNANRLTRKK